VEATIYESPEKTPRLTVEGTVYESSKQASGLAVVATECNSPEKTPNVNHTRKPDVSSAFTPPLMVQRKIAIIQIRIGFIATLELP
jgi:hypothetical protein